MEIITDPKELALKFIDILKSNQINDRVSEVDVKDAGLQGAGFASLTKLVTVKFENQNLKPLNLFVKLRTNNPSHTKYLEELKSFEKEAIFLIDYVAAAGEMCASKGHPELVDFYPKCYYGDENMIVLENLKVEKGYVILNNQERQDLNAAQFAIKTLAKHHAISHAMIQESGGADKFFQDFNDLQHEAFSSPFFQEITRLSTMKNTQTKIKILERHGDIKGAQEAIETLKTFLERPQGILFDSLKKEDSFLVLGHGDYQSNNMMFKFDEETNEIIHHIAIDFQITRYCSPGVDLGYYFFLNAKRYVRKDHLEELLNLYKNTFNGVTKDLGYPTNLTYEDILLEYRKTFGYGFIMALDLTIGPGWSVFKDGDMDISKIEMIDFGEIVDRLTNKWYDENPDKCRETAEDLVKFLEEYNELKL